MPPATNRNVFTSNHLQQITTSADQNPCVICCEAYNTSHTAVRVVGIENCTHTFGSHCLTQWLDSECFNNNACPLCRTVWFGPIRPSPTQRLGEQFEHISFDMISRMADRHRELQRSLRNQAQSSRAAAAAGEAPPPPRLRSLDDTLQVGARYADDVLRDNNNNGLPPSLASPGRGAEVTEPFHRPQGAWSDFVARYPTPVRDEPHDFLAEQNAMRAEQDALRVRRRAEMARGDVGFPQQEDRNLRQVTRALQEENRSLRQRLRDAEQETRNARQEVRELRRELLLVQTRLLA